MDTGLSARRRGWILLTAIAATCMFSWTSISHLSELVELQQLPSDVPDLADRSYRSQDKLPSKLPSGTGFRGDMSSLNVDTQQQPKKTKTNDATLAARKDGSASTRSQTKSTTTTKPKTTTKSTSTGSNSSKVTGACKASSVMEHTDFWGDALVNGAYNKVNSADECCKKCADFKGEGPPEDALDCNVWVYCGDTNLCAEHLGECWLKHLAHPSGTAPAREGPDVGWTTGIMTATSLLAEPAVNDPNDDRKYHIIITAQGSATHWQSRLHYYWYKKIKKQCEAAGNCQMGGWTRILHSGVADDLMKEMPTFVAQPLPPENPDHGYIVLNRPYAILQWIQQADIPEKYVLMSEPDHVWLKPMPNLMIGQHAAAFPFFYIEPSKKDYLPVVQKFVGPISRRETEQIAPIGNAPTLLSLSDMKKVVPLWYNLSLAVHNDEQAVKEWGWVQEMYAFTLACYNAGLRDIGLHLKMMSQPPFDTKLDPYYILHFTYGMDYDLDGKFTPGKYGEWRFDKRSYAGLPPPRNLGEPPAGCENELVRHLIRALNEATNAIPGWDEYSKTGVATEIWDGVIKD